MGPKVMEQVHLPYVSDSACDLSCVKASEPACTTADLEQKANNPHTAKLSSTSEGQHEKSVCFPTQAAE